MRRARRRAPLREMPLVVISRGHPSALPPELGADPIRDTERAWRKGQRMLARLLSGARRWIAKGSGHYVMFDQPRIVIRAIRRVVASAPDRAQRPAMRPVPPLLHAIGELRQLVRRTSAVSSR